MITPVTLSPAELDTVLERIAPNGKEYAAARICRMLAEEHSVQTVRINTRCSVGNISDQVSKFINSRIADLGLYVTCVKPPYKILNQYGQPSGQMLWSFYRERAANDSCYDKEKLEADLRRDVAALQAEFNMPNSASESASSWMDTLQGVGCGETG
jgi:hypothetical protein